MRFAEVTAAAFLALAAAGCAHLRGDPAVRGHAVMMGPDFERFWSAARSRPLDEQIRLWDELVEKPHQAFYDALVWNKSRDASWPEKKRKRLGRLLPEYAALAPAIRRGFESFPSTLEEHIERFRRVLPGATFDVPIYAALAPTFNGRTGTLEDGSHRTVLAFGIDVIAERRDPPDVLYAHELFHVHHARMSGITDDGLMRNERMTLPLWTEGLATYASGLVNPGATDGALLADEELGRLPERELPWLAAEFSKDMDAAAVDLAHPSTAVRWFSYGGARLRPDLPYRCGYLLGLHVVREIARTHSLQEMVAWPPERAHEIVRSVITGMAIAGAPSRTPWRGASRRAHPELTRQAATARQAEPITAGPASRSW